MGRKRMKKFINVLVEMKVLVITFMTREKEIVVYKGIKIRMDEEEYRKFEEIKKELGLKHDVEVIRYLINFFYKHQIQK